MMMEDDLTYHRIKPFICSTDEFIKEREALSADVFPRLKDVCEARGASFSPYDWDLGLSQERLESGLPLQLALDCITAASPFFICILGTKYGNYRTEGSAPLSRDTNWKDCHGIELNILTAAEAGYTWLLDESYASTSLFEFKVMHAAFFSDATQYIRFYIQERVPHLSDEVNQFEKFKLQQLKAGIASRGLHASYFRHVEDLKAAVWADWTAIIDKLIPPIKCKNFNIQLHFDEVQHSDFGNKKSEHFVQYEGMVDCFQKLSDFSLASNDYAYNPRSRANKFEKSTGIRLLRKEGSKKHVHGDCICEETSRSICVLTGPRGCGKSSLVSQWLNECPKSITDNVKVIRHYVACDRMARNMAVFMKRCITELRMTFTKNYAEILSFDEDYVDFGQLREAFLAALNLGPSLILLDGLDEISDSMDMSIAELKKMEWLADVLPPMCKIIITATDSDLSVKSLRARRDIVIVNCPAINNVESKSLLLDGYLNVFEQSLTASQKTQILNYKLSSSPIYLYMIAHEMRDLSVARDADSHLAVYANLDSVSASTRDMWISLIKRWVRDYSWNRYQQEEKTSQLPEKLQETVVSGWVPDAIRLIACSRNGLHIDEILDTLQRNLGYIGKSAIMAYDWHLFFRAAQSVFYEKPNGLITIQHEHFIEVLDFLLLGNICPPAKHMMSTTPQDSRRVMGGMERHQYHNSLASHLLSKPTEVQVTRVEEILWQLEMSRDYIRLCSLLTLPQVLSKMNGPVFSIYHPLKVELVRFFKLLKANNVDLEHKIMQRLCNSSMIKKLKESRLLDLPSLVESGVSHGKPDDSLCTDQQDSTTEATAQNSTLSDDYRKFGITSSAVMPNSSASKQITGSEVTVSGSAAAVSRSAAATSRSAAATPGSVAAVSGSEPAIFGSEPAVSGLEAKSELAATMLESAPHILKSESIPSASAEVSDLPAVSASVQVWDSSHIPSIEDERFTSTEIQRIVDEQYDSITGSDETNAGLVEQKDKVNNVTGQEMLLQRRQLTVYEATHFTLTLSQLLSAIRCGQKAKTLLKQLYCWVPQNGPLTQREKLYYSLNLMQLATCESRDGNTSESLKLLNKAYDSVQLYMSDEESSEENLIAYLRARCLCDMSMLSSSLDKFGQAQSYLHEAEPTMAAIRCMHGSMYCVYTQAILRLKQKSYLVASEQLSRCLEYFELWLGTMHPMVSDISHYLGVLYANEDNCDCHEPVLAEEFLWKCLNIRRENDPASLRTANTLFELAFLVQKQGSRIRKREAAELLTNCLDIRTQQLGLEHEDTLKASYLLNDLEIALQLGHFEFGDAKPKDLRTKDLPFSQLSMHDKALSEFHKRQSRPKSHHGVTQNIHSASASRPLSSFHSTKLRNKSRLEQNLVSLRPKTAPMRLQSSPTFRLETALLLNEQSTSNSDATEPDYKKIETVAGVGDDIHSGDTSPRSYCSISQGDYKSHHSRPNSVLDKYSRLNSATSPRPQSSKGQQQRQQTYHKCTYIGPHDIHPKLRSTTLGPNSTITSVVGYIRPDIHSPAIHKTAWYHQPTNYRPKMPHVNTWSPNRLKERSKRAPLKSQFLNSNTTYIVQPEVPQHNFY